MSGQRLSFVHRYVPGKGDAAGTTPLLLHDTGANDNELLDLGRTLLPSATLRSPRGQVVENGMPRFFHWHAEGVFELDDLQRHEHKLADLPGEA